MESFMELYDGRPIRKLNLKDNSQKTEVSEPATRLSFESLKTVFISVFLPNGYPRSVSDDYVSYQVFDTLQALASSLNGALATEAVLRGAGVGDQSASALAASLTWLVKDGMGMLGRIFFTYVKGSDLDANPKRWRLMADILNDAAFFVDLLLPLFPSLFLPLACLSSLFRCVVGVAGGATRTSITQHQALRNNLADVAAKDGSQETLVNVIALVMSLILLPLVSGKPYLIWALFALFTCAHLYCNYRAVRSLRFKSLNRNRTSIIIRSFLKHGNVPSVDDCNRDEPLFYSTCGIRHLGCSVGELFEFRKKVPNAKFVQTKEYILLFDYHHNVGWVALPEESTDVLEPFFHLQCLYLDAPFSKNLFQCFHERAEAGGFDITTLHLRYDSWRYRLQE